MDDRKIMYDNSDDHRIRELLRDTAQETAPEGFSKQVMEQISLASAPKSAATPLIPRIGWVLLISGVLALASWALLGIGSSPDGLELPGWLDAAMARMGQASTSLPAWNLPGWDIPALPRTFAYGGAALTVFALLQFAWMRHYVNNRLTY